MTWGLILINALVFLHESSLGRGRLEEFYEHYGLVPAQVGAGWGGGPAEVAEDFWPFLTMMFIHGGWIHLLGNMWTLYLFGDNVEGRMGPGRFLVFYLLCGLAAGGAQYFTNPDSAVPAIGASGAIAGVMGAYLVLFPHARVVTIIPIFIFPLFVQFPAFFYLGFWYLTQLLNGTMAIHDEMAVGGVAWWAHVGGFAAGIALLPVFLAGNPPPWERRRVAAPGAPEYLMPRERL